MTKTIAIDFDGVIHRYSEGYKNGEIYDQPNVGALSAIRWMIIQGYSVFIFSTRSPKQIKKWLDGFVWFYDAFYGDSYGRYYEFYFKPVVIPWYKKFWNQAKKDAGYANPALVGITKRKLPAHVYIDDRALKFDGDWNNTVKEIKALFS